jgi:hypothetical protein
VKVQLLTKHLLNVVVQNKTAASYGNVQPWLRTSFDVGKNTAAIPIFYYNNQSYVNDYFQNATVVQVRIMSGTYQPFHFADCRLLYSVLSAVPINRASHSVFCSTSSF